MTFKKIENDETVPHWISKAYKIVQYDYRGNVKQKTYHAYHKTWNTKSKIFVSGDYIDRDNPDYDTLNEAKKACEKHAIIHPKIANNPKMYYTE